MPANFLTRFLAIAGPFANTPARLFENGNDNDDEQSLPSCLFQTGRTTAGRKARNSQAFWPKPSPNEKHNDDDVNK